mmetsp:Transcript_62631/g.198310  ORF Transcript_62631/g.198310 Transcript_62631/m.198310 type:complete len:219 (-) Transcript_62631:1454-2110(-)
MPSLDLGVPGLTPPTLSPPMLSLELVGLTPRPCPGAPGCLNRSMRVSLATRWARVGVPGDAPSNELPRDKAARVGAVRCCPRATARRTPTCASEASEERRPAEPLGWWGDPTLGSKAATPEAPERGEEFRPGWATRLVRRRRCSSARTSRATSSPESLGIWRSRKATWGRSALMRARASAPFAAVMGSQPRDLSSRAPILRVTVSSSARSTLIFAGSL